jgi:hypothetical protein
VRTALQPRKAGLRNALKELTKALLAQFYLPLWRKEPPRGFEFAADAFDALMALESGAWVHREPIVLLGLVTEVVADAMAAARGTEQIEATARGALEAFAELRTLEAPNYKERARFEPALKKAEEEVRKLIPPEAAKGLFGWLGGSNKGVPTQDPNKPIKITSAHVLSEFICHNVSEFHYPGFKPRGIN